MAKKLNWHGISHVLIYMAAFALIFSAIGYFVPKIYFTYIPNENILEIKHLIAPNASYGDKFHIVEFHRIAHYNMLTQTAKELVLIDSKTNLTISNSIIGKTFIESGEYSFNIPFQLYQDEPIQRGSYYWSLGLQLDLPNGVTRSMTVESNIFEVQ